MSKSPFPDRVLDAMFGARIWEETLAGLEARPERSLDDLRMILTVQRIVIAGHKAVSEAIREFLTSNLGWTEEEIDVAVMDRILDNPRLFDHLVRR